LDIRSFASEETPSSQESSENFAPSVRPFLSIYEMGEGGSPINEEAEEYAAFLNRLYDEEFNEALYEQVSDAAKLYETQLMNEYMDSLASSHMAEKALEVHFAPFVREAEGMIGTLAEQLGQRDISSLTENDIEALVNQYKPSGDLGPNFENFFGSIFKKIGGFVKKVATGAVDLAKKGISAIASLGLGPILNKLKGLIKPLIRKVLQMAINRLPAHLQPIAANLSERLPFLKEFEESYDSESEDMAASSVAEIQQEFDYRVANLLFAPGNAELELEVAEATAEAQAPAGDSLAELDQARVQFMEALSQLKEGEDVTPHMERFVPALLPALRFGIRIVGRERVVNFLAKFLGKLIQNFVSPQYRDALSQAIVDTGLRLMTLEASPRDAADIARCSITNLVEETVRTVAAQPDYMLDNPELLEAVTLEAFEQAAAANLPPILSDKTYLSRPDLIESRSLRGTWLSMPLQSRKKRYKKYSQVIRTTITPHKASTIITFGGLPLSEYLEEHLGIAPGENVEAEVHLYESTPETLLSEVTRLEQNTPGLGSSDAYVRLHPLTTEAAGLLLGEPGLGREAKARYLANPYTSKIGQRFYHLNIPNRRSLSAIGPKDRARMHRTTQLNLLMDFQNNQIRIYQYLSEKRAQEIAVKLRQQAHVGMITSQLGRILKRGLHRTLIGGFGLKIIHEAVVPEQWAGSLQRLPSVVPQILEHKLHEWVLKSLSEFIKNNAMQFIAATEDPANGVTLIITVANPPGFANIRQALKGRGMPLPSLKLAEGMPTVGIRVAPGYIYD
jgi:predicted DNA-binding transcriptional regulator